MSPVLEAMGVPREYALGTLRLCVGRATTAEEIDHAVAHILQAVISLSVVTSAQSDVHSG